MSNVELIFTQLGARGERFSKMTQTLNLNLTQARYDDIFKHGMIVHKSIEPDESAQMLRVVVLDRSSGNIGSLTIPMKPK